MRFLGIDPGTTRIGYGLIEHKNGLFTPVDFGLLPIDTEKDKLVGMGKSLALLIKKTKPDIIAIEELFFTKNQKTAISVAEARGVLKFISLESGVEVREYGPREVKMAVTSNGVADKKSVATMVAKILSLKKITGPDDISDALAVALTAAFRYKFDSLK